MIIAISEPPNPNDSGYAANPKLYNQAMYQWACALKAQLQMQNRTITRPTSQSFQVTAYTTNTAISGTSTGTDIANFVCSVVAALQNKGIIATLPTKQ